MLKSVAYRLKSLVKEPKGITTMFPLQSKLKREMFFFKDISTYPNMHYYPFIYYEKVENYKYDRWFLPKIEIVKGEKTKEKIFDNLESDYIIPIGIHEKDTRLTITSGHQEDTLIGFHPNRVIYLPTKNKIEIKADKEIVIGDIINVEQKKQTKYKLILQIFVDGLSAHAFKDENERFNDVMPYTSRFFRHGSIFNKCYSNGEWTLPSSASIFSGNYSANHGLFHNLKEHHINAKMISEYLKEAGYLTFQAGGNWRQSPTYGYYKGFDRTIYRSCIDIGMDVHEVIKSFKEQLRAFPKRSIFASLNFFELHNVFYGILADISSQIKNPINSKSTNSALHGVSVFSQRNKDALEVYYNELSRLDFYLNEIYSLVNTMYNDDETLVVLTSDHGQSYISSENRVLGKKRTHVMCMMKCTEMLDSYNNYLVENVDILPSVLDLCEIKYNRDEIDGISLLSRIRERQTKSHTYSESIFPGQSYKACVRTVEREFFFDAIEKLQEDLFISIKDAEISVYDNCGQEITGIVDNQEILWFKNVVRNHIESSSILKLRD